MDFIVSYVFPPTPLSIYLCSRLSCQIESKAFLKSTKHEKTLPLFWFVCLSIRVCRVNTWSVCKTFGKKPILIFAQYIVFTEEMYESDVNDNAEDFPKVAVDACPTVVIRVKFVSTFMDWGDQSFQILGKMPELRMMLKSLSVANCNLWSVLFVI